MILVDPGFELFEHQYRAVEKLEERDGCAGLFMEMGTGKTRAALAYIHDVARRVLVISPLMVGSVWEREIAKLPTARKFQVHQALTGTIANRARWLKLFGESGVNGIVLVNYEAAWREPLRSAILRWQPDTVLADEAHRIKHRQTRQAKLLHFLASSTTVQRRIALSGTPMTQGVQDLFSIYKFVDDTVFGSRWADFQAHCLKMGGYQGREIIGYQEDRLQEIEEKIAQTSFRITRDECLDLPPRTDVVVPIRLSTETRRVYDKMKKEGLSELDGTDENGRPFRGVALARITLTNIMRRQQLTSGFCKTEEGPLVDISSEKVDAAQQIVTDAVAQGERVVVFCRFIHDVERVSAAISPTVLHGVMTGDTSKKERDRVLHDIESGAISCIVAQIQVGGLGVNEMVAASIAVFTSVGFKVDDFQQARDRLHRIGQTRRVVYYHLLADKTVDGEVYQALSEKRSIAATVMRDPEAARRLLNA